MVENLNLELESDPEFEEDVEDANDADMIESFDPSLINVQPKQDTLRNIIDRLRNKEIDMNTDFQRHAELWSPSKMSRLIESILIRFPLPAFYFDASDENNWLIVDGLQRLSAINKFVVEGKLRLSNLEYMKDLIGKKYADIGRQFQRRIDECPVTLFQILPGTPDEVKYSIFRRINTGGLVLNNQEIRNAMAKPKERAFLERLASDENLKATMGDHSKRMLDQELVLRFIAFSTQDYHSSKKNIAAFLDEAMKTLKNSSQYSLNKLEQDFARSISLCNQIFGSDAFEKKISEDGERKIRKNTTLFEVWTVLLARTSESEAACLVGRKDQVVKKLQDLVGNDEEFYRAISLATQKRDHVQVRYDRIGKLIKEVVDA